MRTASTLLALLALGAAASAQEGTVAIRAGKLVTSGGQSRENVTLLVRNGRIEAVGGADLEVPFDVVVHEHPEATLFAGYGVAYSSSGMDRSNESVPIAPFLDVRDSIDPVSFYYEDELRKGVVAIGILPGNNTVIGGTGLLVAPHGLTIEDMSHSDDLGMKLSMAQNGWSRSAQLAELREAFDGLRDKLRRLGQQLLDEDAANADLERAGEETPDEDAAGQGDDAGGFVRFGEDFPGKERISARDLDDTQRGLVEILNGDHRLWIWAPGPSEVFQARAWATSEGLLEKVVFVVSAEAWKAADALAESGRPVVLSGSLFHVERDPVTWEEVRTFAPKVFEETGIPFAILPQTGSMGPDRLAYQAASCVREGVSRRTALAAVTTVPARCWGLEARLGTLQEGADGTFVLLDGDPLDPNAKVLEVWRRGNRIYERATDARLERILEGKNP